MMKWFFCIMQVSFLLFAYESIERFAEILPSIHAHTLLVLDIDDTLTKTPQVLGTRAWQKYWVNKTMNEEGCSLKEAFYASLPLFHQILCHTRVIPTEKTIPWILSDLQKKNVFVLGLTARPSELAYFTLENLRSIGIQLNPPFSIQSPYDLSMDYSARYIGGIVFATGSNSKGEALFTLCERIDYQPTHIVFVDDVERNIQDVERACKERGVPYDGFLYLPTQDSFDVHAIEISEKQLQCFEGILSDEDAEKLLRFPREKLVAGEI